MKEAAVLMRSANYIFRGKHKITLDTSASRKKKSAGKIDFTLMNYSERTILSNSTKTDGEMKKISTDVGHRDVKLPRVEMLG